MNNGSANDGRGTVGTLIYVSGTYNVNGVGTGDVVVRETTTQGGATSGITSTLQIGRTGTNAINNGNANNLARNINVLSGGRVVFDHNNAITRSQEIYGAGTLTKQGTGNLTLSGTNRYTRLVP